MQSNYDTLINKLDGFVRKYYKNQLIKGGIYSVSLLFIAYTTVVLLEYYGHFSMLMRGILFYSFVVSALYILIKLFVLPLMKLYKLGDVISHEQAAQIIGKHFGEVKDKLLNTLQLKKLSLENPESAAFIEAGIDQKTTELRPVPFTAAIDFSENKKYLKFFLPPLLLLLLILFASPGIIRDGTERLVNYNVYYEKQAPFSFNVMNDKLETVQQEDFLLNVKMTGEEIPENVYIRLGDVKYKMKKEDNVTFKYLFKNVQKNVEFDLLAENFSSKPYELVALPNPIILNFNVELDYPAYTGRKDEKIKNTGDMVIPAGTKVSWQFKTQNTQKLLLDFKDTSHVINRNSEDVFTFSSRFFKNKSYVVKTENEFLRGRDSISYGINVIPDQYPSIEVEERADSLSSKRIYFRGMIKDDYGFKKLIFNYRKLNEGKSGEQNSRPININTSQLQDQFFHLWDLSSLDIKAGDEIAYYFEVWDNDGVNGSKSTKSHQKIFKAPTLDELSEKKEKTNKEIKKDMTESIEEARELQKEMEELNKKLLEKKDIGWDEKKRMEQLLKKQKELEKKVDNIKDQNKKMQLQENEYKKVNESILEKQKRLEQLFEDVMTEEMKEKFRQLEELMEKLDKNKMKEMLEEMQLSNEDIEKELDRTLEIFKQLEFEQKLEETIEKLNELAEKEEKLSEKTENKSEDNEALKKEQEALEKEFEKLKKDMEDLEKKNSELENSHEMPELEEGKKNTDQKMQDSKEQLDKKKNKKASESQKNASDEMKKMEQQLQEMQSSMQMQGNMEDLNALRALLENLVELSFDQERLMLELSETGKNDPKYVEIGQEQRKLKDDAKMIEDSLFALSKRVIQIEAIVNREINDINQNMQKSLDFIGERKTPMATSRQQYIMTSVNNLALLLDEIVQQMQQQMSQQKFGNSSCNKPGSSKPSPASMRQMQQQINQQMEQLKQQMEKEGGKKPGKKGGKGGNISEKLAKLAAEQAAIREELRKMADELGKDGNMGGKKQMEKLGEKMEETETDLVNKNITRETLKRQQEILSKLLEHEKADREQDWDQKRESREAKNENFSNPSEFFEYNRKKEKEVELLKTVPPSLKTFYKNKVNEYFNNYED